jgi:hypothetical protein
VLCELRPNNQSVTESTCKDGCTEFLPEKSARQAWYDIKKRLQQGRYIAINEAGEVARLLEDPGVTG